MKKYIIPALRIADINNETLLAGSGMDNVGREYNSGDVTYGNRRGLFDWTDEDED